jgi:heme/copper-type cytochrome/quinol oxidase subunit 3
VVFPPFGCIHIFIIINLLRCFTFQRTAWPSAALVFQSVPGLIEHGAPLVFVGLMTFILIMSSVTMVLAVEAGHRNAQKRSGLVDDSHY